MLDFFVARPVGLGIYRVMLCVFLLSLFVLL